MCVHEFMYVSTGMPVPQHICGDEGTISRIDYLVSI